MTNIKEEDMEDLALLLLYLSSWDEDPKRKYSKEPVLRAWKNIRFEILDKLNEKEFISDSKGRKSIYLTNNGIKKAVFHYKRALENTKNMTNAAPAFVPKKSIEIIEEALKMVVSKIDAK